MDWITTLLHGSKWYKERAFIVDLQELTSCDQTSIEVKVLI